jgi:molybdate transport repressor ModE-like protein
MSKPATTSRPTQPTIPLPRLRWNWDFGVALSDADTRRLLELLSALLETAALGKAATLAGMSYRAAWGLLRRCEEEFGLVLVTMERGRGTRLTALGESLVEMDGAARLALAEVHAVWEARMRALVEPVMQSVEHGAARLSVHASHDLALADWMEHGRRVPVDIEWHGSEEALAALGRGECDMAGFHVPEAWSVDQFAGWLKRWLKPSLHVCVPVMRRTQGLLVARGNPLQLHSLADVAQRGARLVNRQRGSGTRSLIDQLLTHSGIVPERVAGYAHEEFTHEAVAATIAGGQADAGFGIAAAAARYDLDFIPLMQERYGFAMTRSVLKSVTGQTFLRRLAGRTFHQRLNALPGYVALTTRVPLAPSERWEDFLAS